MSMYWAVIVVFHWLCGEATAEHQTSDLKCNVRARIDSGWVCGLVREAELGVKYASFRGIPYGQQPLGELRFKELQPVKPWYHHLDATKEGPICPQHDEIYQGLIKPVMGMSESCIYANVHVPIEALPTVGRADDEFEDDHEYHRRGKGYPIFVFIHGGGFAMGSGDTDLHGPEYLVSKGVIVITFNYRINVFGFLSLNTPKIPGNAGLRDQVTLLRWVQRNARAFGGDPNEVTLGGQSAGAASAHLLALSRETKGLFKRVIIMSGTAITSFYTASPAYATFAAAQFLKILGINSTNPDVIHERLVNTPIEDIINANSEFQDVSGLVGFMPVIEPKYPGVTRVIDDDPVRLIQSGRDKEYPMIVGFTNNECVFFVHRLMYIQLLRRIKENPLLVLAAGIAFEASPPVSLYLAQLVIKKYYNGKLNYGDLLRSCKDTYFEYPAYQLVRWRGEMRAAPSYLYQFTYPSDHSVIKAGLNLQYEGSAHVEDLTYVFHENAVLGDQRSFPPRDTDDKMKDWMTMFVVNFMRCNDPSCGAAWPPVNPKILNYQLIHKPGVYHDRAPTHDEWDMICFHDTINQIGRNLTSAGSSSKVCSTYYGDYTNYFVPLDLNVSNKNVTREYFNCFISLCCLRDLLDDELIKRCIIVATVPLYQWRTVVTAPLSVSTFIY